MQLDKDMKVIDMEETSTAKVEVVEVDKLKGSDNLQASETLFMMNESGVRMKMIRVTLRDSVLQTEPGALYFMKGNLALSSDTNGGIARGLFRSIVNGETFFQSKIQGSGEIYLEPTFGHYMMINLDNDELIVDKGIFYCATQGVEVGSKMQGNVSSALFGGEGFFQTSIKGTGIVVLNCPVPASELMMVQLGKGEKISVDGNFAIARTGSVEFKAEKSAGSLFQSATSGELLLQTFTGPGIVWIAPTQMVYDRIASERINGMANHQGSIGTRTNS